MSIDSENNKLTNNKYSKDWLDSDEILNIVLQNNYSSNNNPLINLELTNKNKTKVELILKAVLEGFIRYHIIGNQWYLCIKPSTFAYKTAVELMEKEGLFKGNDLTKGRKKTMRQYLKNDPLMENAYIYETYNELKDFLYYLIYDYILNDQSLFNYRKRIKIFKGKIITDWEKEFTEEEILLNPESKYLSSCNEEGVYYAYKKIKQNKQKLDKIINILYPISKMSKNLNDYI